MFTYKGFIIFDPPATASAIQEADSLVTGVGEVLDFIPAELTMTYRVWADTEWNLAMKLRDLKDDLDAAYVTMDPIDRANVEEEEERLPFRQIGYTAEECERDMRRMTHGERGCANPAEHETNLKAHMKEKGR